MKSKSLSPREQREKNLKIDEEIDNGSGWEMPNHVRTETVFNIEKYLLPKSPKTECVGKVFPKGKVSLLYGIIGSGKSYTTLKALTEDGIKPFYVNLDHTDGLEEFDMVEVGYDVITALFSGLADDFIKDGVVVIDTYTRLKEHPIFNSLSDEDIVAILEELCIKANTTLIIIGHAGDYVGAKDIFDDNPILARSAHECILLDKKYKAGKGKDIKGFHIECRLLKGRGIGGPREVPELSRIIRSN